MTDARVLDCDGTIIKKAERTLLETLMLDFYKKQDVKRKIDLAIRYLVIKSYKSLSSCIGKIFGDEQITGETTSLELFEVLMLKDAGMPMDFVRERAKEYSRWIEPRHVAEFKKCNDDIYIVSAEPVQLIEEIVKNVGLEEHIQKIYGTKFKVEDGIITGFERVNLFAGVRGKYLGMQEIILKGYQHIYAIGDSMADIGLFSAHKKIIPFTFSDSPKELVDYVKSSNGLIVDDLAEFFKKKL